MCTIRQEIELKNCRLSCYLKGWLSKFKQLAVWREISEKQEASLLLFESGWYWCRYLSPRKNAVGELICFDLKTAVIKINECLWQFSQAQLFHRPKDNNPDLLPSSLMSFVPLWPAYCHCRYFDDGRLHNGLPAAWGFVLVRPLMDQTYPSISLKTGASLHCPDHNATRRCQDVRCRDYRYWRH